MKTNEKTDTALPLALPVWKGDGLSSMPEAFAGIFQAGFESGYKRGREAGYRQGFNEGTAAVHQGPNNGAVTKSAVEGNPSPKSWTAADAPRHAMCTLPGVPAE